MFQGEIVVGFILWGTQVCTSLLRRCLDIYIRYGGTRGKVRGLPKSAGVVLGNMEVIMCQHVQNLSIKYLLRYSSLDQN